VVVVGVVVVGVVGELPVVLVGAGDNNDEGDELTVDEAGELAAAGCDAVKKAEPEDE
jgi:hypothetical protein